MIRVKMVIRAVGFVIFVLFILCGCQHHKPEITKQPIPRNWKWIKCKQSPFQVIRIGSFRLWKVSGVVVKGPPGLAFPLPGAVVSLKRIKNSRIYRTTTDKKGRFKFSFLPWGRYEFGVCCPGWETLEGYIILSPIAIKGKIKFALPLGK